MTAKNLKPEDAKAMQANEAEPNFEDLEFSASTEVKEVPQELKQAAVSTPAPGNVVPMNKAAAPGQPQVQVKQTMQAQPQQQSANIIEIQNRMKMMEIQQQAQLKLVEQTVTEILINIKQKSASIDQDIMRIKKILDNLNIKK